ncbi:MAG: regulatory protein [Gaiellaceae bacterium]|jgi:regulatory protein|nr:regulatory protein [Gaiellaceae bacterium]
MADQDPIEIAARALRHRDRSRREIEERLARAGIDDDRRTDALDTLERVGYVDDGRFAGARAEALANRGYGDEWIRHDLGEHGVAAEAIAEAIGALVPESDRAASLVERLGRTPKTGAQLTRKGFGEDAVAAALGIDLGN